MAILSLDSVIISDATKKELAEWFQDKEQIRTAISAFLAGIPKRPRPAIPVDEMPYLYASTPISTGKKLIEGLLRHSYPSKEEFRKQDDEAYRTEVLIPNIEDGNEFSLDCEKKFDKVFAPSRFAGGMRWKDAQYMVFYRPVVERGCWGMAFNARAGFTWSTGCIEELGMGLEHEKKLYVWNGPDQFSPLDGQAVIEEIYHNMEIIREVTGEIPLRFAEYWLDVAVRVGSAQNQNDIKKLAQIKNG